MSRFRMRALALALALPLLAVACGGGGDDDGNGEAGGGGEEQELASQCPVGALENATKPVEITMWHSTTRVPNETLVKLVDRFNSEQGDVRVKLVNQTSYEETLTQYRAALGRGQLPDVVQIQDVDQRLVIDSQSVLPVEACVQATDYDMDDVLPRVQAYYTIDDVMWSMPFAVSNPLLYYNKNLFRAAGLDPEKPPTNLEEVQQIAEKIVSSGAATHGIAIKNDPWYLEMWHGMAGELYANNDNGRDGRATEVVFDDPLGEEIFTWMSEMAKSRAGQLTAYQSAGGGIDNVLAVANKTAAMTLESSAGLGSVLQVLETGQFADIDFGVAPLPGPAGDGGSIVAGSSLFMTNKGPDERQAATWEFVSWLNQPEQIAEWAAATGYIPIRTSATELPAVKDRWAQQPFFKIAYDQLSTGETNAASAGPVIGDMEAVRRAVRDGQDAIWNRGADPLATLKDVAAKADAAIEDYESRIGG